MRRVVTLFLLVFTACPQTPEPPALPPATPSPPPAPAMQPPAAEVLPDVPAAASAARDAELAKKAAGVLDVFVNQNAYFAPDGKHVVYTSDRDGLSQVYLTEVGKPEAPPLRLVTSTDRATRPQITPDGKSVIFISDKGADEKWSIYRVGLDGKDLVNLTPGAPLQRSAPFIPVKAPDKMFYTAQALSDPKPRLYAQALSPEAPPKLLFTATQPGHLSDVSPDGKYALFTQTPSLSDSTLDLIDLATGAAKRLYPPAGKAVNVFDAGFNSDGSRVVLATDDGGEQAVLMSLETATGAEKARRVEKDPATATIGLSGASRKGDLLVENVNAGSHTKLRIIDGRTTKLKKEIAMPLGTGFVARFSDDGKYALAVWGTPESPSDLYLADTATGKATLLRKDPRPGLASLGGIEATTTEVPTFDGLKIPVNVYRPKEGKGPAPVLIMVHGGPAGNSAVRWDPFKRFYLSLGYAIVEPNIRGSTGFGRAYEMGDNGPKRLDAVKDLEAVGRWTAKQPFADKDRLVVYGGSYGGYMVLMGLTRQPDLWRAGVDLFGVANMKTFMTSTMGAIRQLFLVEFGDPDKDAPFLASISPLSDVTKIVDPLFVYAGANDPRVPKPESDQIVRALRERKVPVEYMVAKDEGHSLSHRANQVEFLSRSARFLEQSLSAK